ncbi:acyl carrier protein [Actinoplanes sp. CA-030573]|uniref:acyl carrier protein n=1 Tax=Actinoplanes sp. CA-030573 TaxID=3239898 RepID=UPI003D8BC370
MTAKVVRTVLAQISGRPIADLSDADRLVDLGLDSLGRLTLAVLIEEKTGRPLPDDALLRVRTLADLEQLVEPAGANS